MSHDMCGTGPEHAGEIDHGHERSLDPSHGGSHDGHSPTSPAPGRTGIITSKDRVEVHVESHGPCDVKGMFVEIASGLDLLAIDLYRPNLMAEDRHESGILPGDPWDEAQAKPSTNPSGWYPGCTGRTRLWKEFWHLGKRDGWWIFKGPLKTNFRSMTSLEISCVTRSYVETGDCQTDLVIQVESLPFWSKYIRDWRFDDHWARLHRQVAEKVATRVLAYLQAHPPLTEAALIRQQKRQPDRARPLVLLPVPPSTLPTWLTRTLPSLSTQAPACQSGSANGPVSPECASGADLENIFREPSPDRAQGLGSAGHGGGGGGGE